VLITPFCVSYNLIYECFRNYMFAKNYAFLHFHRAISEKLQHENLQFFISPMALQVYQVWIKSEMVSFFHWFAWHAEMYQSSAVVLLGHAVCLQVMYAASSGLFPTFSSNLLKLQLYCYIICFVISRSQRPLGTKWNVVQCPFTRMLGGPHTRLDILGVR
jgi:hypothetical protein